MYSLLPQAQHRSHTQLSGEMLKVFIDDMFLAEKLVKAVDKFLVRPGCVLV
jgi:hypothetical protein